jgi:hypothetical protein
MSKRSCGEAILSRATTASDGYLKELEPTLRQTIKIRGALPDEDAATKGDVPGTPQPGKKMKRRPGEINTLNQLALSWEVNFSRQRYRQTNNLNAIVSRKMLDAAKSGRKR